MQLQHSAKKLRYLSISLHIRLLVISLANIIDKVNSDTLMCLDSGYLRQLISLLSTRSHFPLMAYCPHNLQHKIIMVHKTHILELEFATA